jgi:hypothetical protein
MLYGEPYLLNYKATIHELLEKHQFTYFEYIPNHVGLWIFSHTKEIDIAQISQKQNKLSLKS